MSNATKYGPSHRSELAYLLARISVCRFCLQAEAVFIVSAESREDCGVMRGRGADADDNGDGNVDDNVDDND